MKKQLLYRQWFNMFMRYNLVFLSLQLAFILLNNHQISFVSTIHLPYIIYVNLFATLIAHISLYIILSLIQTALLWGTLQHQHNQTSLERWQLIIWSLSVTALLTLNLYFFPQSLFSRIFLPELPPTFILALLFISLNLLSYLSLNTLFYFMKKHPKHSSGFIAIFAIVLLYTVTHPNLSPHQNAKNQLPNVILIGIDSLTPQRINHQDMPTLTTFTQQSVFFKETISPLANTYPAWASILTGLYPEHHQGRYNLMPPHLVKSSQSIVWLLRQQGYQTLFATDDRQFNMIGKEFGFQTLIAPKGGANDFLISALNDFPLSNLLVNLPIGRWLFPFNHMNRASFFTYYPTSFEKELQQALTNHKKNLPAFIAIHLTLPHWPYIWAKSMPEKKSNDPIKTSKQHHQAALKRVDQQIAQLLSILQQSGYLDNSMLILLSDHGEGFYVQGSRQTNPHYYQGHRPGLFAHYIKQKTSTTLEMSGGHGSDLLSKDQYHCLLAYKIYHQGQVISLPKIIPTRVALLDIAPTILAYLHLPNQTTDGLSLLPSITTTRSLPERAFIMESGMIPNQSFTKEKIQSLAKEFFSINPHNGHLYLRPGKLKKLDTFKLYAIIQGDWLIALYPDQNKYIPITLHLSDGLWTDDLHTEFAKKSPAIKMIHQMNNFYHKTWALLEPQQSL